jgi:CheY-like chemotaxis protein
MSRKADESGGKISLDLKEPMSGIGSILVAEDDPTDAFFLQRAFAKAGVSISLHFVRDGQEVIDYLRGEPPFADRVVYPLPQLLLLDLKMPRLNGFDVLGWLKQRPDLKRLPVVVFTSSREIADVNHAYDLGANSYLVKPHASEDLMALVERLGRYWVDVNKTPDWGAA